jgi:hypothetical protein
MPRPHQIDVPNRVMQALPGSERKPDDGYPRIARREPGWTTWGDKIAEAAA